MGHRSCIVRHRPTTLPGALSRTWAHHHRRLGRADKKKGGPSRSPRPSTTYVAFILVEGRRLGGSIGAALRSIVLLFLLHDGTIVGLLRPIPAPGELGELHVHERPTAGTTVDWRSSRSTTTTADRVFDVDSGKSIDESVESSVRGRQAARAAGIPDEHRACESISEFEARPSVLEEPGGPSASSRTPLATGIERFSGSISERILSGGSPIRSAKPIRRREDSVGINRTAGIAGVGFKKRYPIVARLILAFHRTTPSEQTITRVGHASCRILLGRSVNQFLQTAVLQATRSFSSFSSWPRGPLIHVTATMTSGRETSFR